MRLDPRFPLAPASPWYTLLLGALVTLASFATDMGLPVLDGTAASLGVSPARAALTLSVFMAGFAAGPLVCGPLSDRFGRRPLLLAGCAAFALFGLLGTVAGSLTTLLVGRTLMGMGAGTVSVLVVATVRDLYSGREARTRQSYVNMAGGVAPIIAPTLGVSIAALGGWRAIYAALTIGGIGLLVLAWLFLRETAPLSRVRALTPRRILGDYGRVLRQPLSVGNALVVALSFGCLFAYVSGSSLVLIGVVGVSARTYGAIFAATASGLVAGALLNARLTRQGVPHTRLLRTALVVAAVAALLLLALALLDALPLRVLVPLLVLGNVAHGVMRPNAVQGALEPSPEIVGVASALLSGLQMLVGASASAIAASLFDGRSALAMTGTMSVCAVGALAVYLVVVRPAERRAAAERARTRTGASSRPARAA
ncbi:MAG TPA: multidrug effflux MFS transporter [Gemmatimonadaceae bacterium]|nr:multidrug effflux MFS transporter [Gemmatimonadaceae bacterium]